MTLRLPINVAVDDVELVAVGLGFIFAFIIPNRPTSIRWLTTQERDQLNYRLEVDRSSKDGTDDVSVGKAFIMAVTDVKTWLLCGCLQMNYVSGPPVYDCPQSEE